MSNDELLRRTSRALKRLLGAFANDLATAAQLRQVYAAEISEAKDLLLRCEEDPLRDALKIAHQNLEDTLHLVEIDAGKDKIIRSLKIKARHAYDAIEDLKKARWYIDREIQKRGAK